MGARQVQGKTLVVAGAASFPWRCSATCVLSASEQFACNRKEKKLPNAICRKTATMRPKCTIHIRKYLVQVRAAQLPANCISRPVSVAHVVWVWEHEIERYILNKMAHGALSDPKIDLRLGTACNVTLYFRVHE